MELSAEVFRDIIKVLRSDTRGDRDKRREPRVGLRSKVTVIHSKLDGGTGAEPPAGAWVRDLSPGGIGLLYPRHLPKGSIFLVRLPRHSGTPILARYTVAHCKALGDHLHSIGARFDRMLDAADDPQRLLSRAAAMVTGMG